MRKVRGIFGASFVIFFLFLCVSGCNSSSTSGRPFFLDDGTILSPAGTDGPGDGSTGGPVVPDLPLIGDGDHGLPAPDPTLLRTEYVASGMFLVKGRPGVVPEGAEVTVVVAPAPGHEEAVPQEERVCRTTAEKHGRFMCKVSGLLQDRLEVRQTSGGVSSDATTRQLRWEASKIAGGQAVSGAGDFNGDGVPDVVVGTSDAADQRGTEIGSVSVISGTVRGSNPLLFSRDGEQPLSRFGASVAGVGDANADGYDDVLVGSSLWRRPGAGDAVGKVYLISGGPCPDRPCGDLLGAVQGEQPGAHFGFSVGPAGDFNRNGASDFFVGAPLYSPEELKNAGQLAVYDGRSVSQGPLVVIRGGKTHDNVGLAAAGGADLNGDGFDDVVMARRDLPPADAADELCFPEDLFMPNALCNRTFRMEAWAGLVELIPGRDCTACEPARVEYRGPDPSEAFGLGLAVGDLNRDGSAEIVVGAPAYGGSFTGPGHVYVFSGVSGGPAFSIAGTTTNDGFGRTVSVLGDYDGDGFGDLAVGRPLLTSDHGARGGGVDIFSGACRWLGTDCPVGVSPDETLGVQGEGLFGYRVADAGDWNGDGNDEILTSAPAVKDETSIAGRLYVVSSR